MDRLAQKLDLLTKLGRVFGPLQEIAENPGDYDQQDREEAIARYHSDGQALNEDVRSFITSQSGHFYQSQYKQFLTAMNAANKTLESGSEISPVLATRLASARDAIYSIPVPRSSVILEARTPFTAYCKLRALCEADAADSITWFDPFFSSDIFHRYLQFVDQAVNVTLIAEAPSPTAGKRNKRRWEDFLDISRLYAKERGVDHYRLLVSSSIHDRWLILDMNRIYSLGGSAKDAAFKDLYTIATVEASEPNLATISGAIDDAEEWFGPTVDTHE